MANTEFDIYSERQERYASACERRRFLEANITPAGGYTRKFLESIGVSWPPKSGWKEDFIKFGPRKKGGQA